MREIEAHYNNEAQIYNQRYLERIHLVEDYIVSEQIKSIYMQNILDDFGSDVMIKGDSLKKFANTLSKAAEGGKLPSSWVIEAVWVA